ncbi:MAG: VOC family protein [Hamadaea sp.]|nr:VOC family protein [Hamadaea sp.]
MDRVVLTRTAASDAVSGLGWRFALGALRTTVRVASLVQAVAVADVVTTPSSTDHLWLDLRPDRVLLTVQAWDLGGVTAAEVALARRLSADVAALGLATEPGEPRTVQALEIAVDALDIAAVRPFWKAVLGYADEPGAGPSGALVDPFRQGPSVWFQQMDAPRPQRNRIHVDVSVPHDEAGRRIAAALAAGGRLVSNAAAPSFWVLADVEGNEVCVTTWQGRD